MSCSRQAFIDLLHQEVVPALGCTEPIAVALTAAKAAETLGRPPQSLTVEVSANLLKNGMGVMVPAPARWVWLSRPLWEPWAAKASSAWNACGI